MSDPAQPLEIVEVSIDPIARPTRSLVVADAPFMSTLKQVEATVASIRITDAQSAQQAADLLTRLTKAGTALEKQRVSLKAPYLALMTQIDTAAKGAANRIDAAKRTLSKLQTDFAVEQRRLADEQERQRQAELKRLEDLRLAEEKAAQEKAAKIAAELKAKQDAEAKIAEAAKAAGLPIKPALVVESWDDELPAAPVVIQKSETEKQIDALRHAPAPVVVKAAGVKEVVTLYPHCVDIDKVPEPFIQKSFKLAAVQSVYCRGWRDGDKIPEVPGIRFEVQRQTVSTGKAGF